MDHFCYRGGELFAEELAVDELALKYGTPLYVYSRATLEKHWHAFDQAFGDYPHSICYSVKANSNLGVLNILAKLGSSFDIVSGGELSRVIAAGGNPALVVFSGVGKLDWEIREALKVGIQCFNVESAPELERIANIATEMNKVAPIAIRINPDVDAQTHPYISTGMKHNKFGVSIDEAITMYQTTHHHVHLKVEGVTCHIGSQLVETRPYEDAMDKMLNFVASLNSQGIELSHIDFGGGLGVRYKDEEPPSPAEYWQAILKKLQAHNIEIPVTIEPGRAIAGNAGILVTRIEYLKQGEVSQFCIVDAAMNDLIRPALYSAYQEIIEVDQNTDSDPQQYDVVGPICESADFLGKERTLSVAQGGLLAVRTAGAYGAVQSSNYNTRGRAAEVIVDGSSAYITRQRETIESLYELESIIPNNQ
ncbi:MAG: diaminopimelate decarboxylase [Cryomorphaceae bacterium]|jgi:diaminopimelate decarboxylase